MSAKPSIPELLRAVQRAENAAAVSTAARADVERVLKEWHGRVSVRAVARRTGLSAATISNVLRGRLTVSLDSVRRIAEALPHCAPTPSTEPRL